MLLFSHFFNPRTGLQWRALQLIRGYAANTAIRYEKVEGFRRLDALTRAVENERQPLADFAAAVTRERTISASLGGRTVLDDRRRRRAAARQNLSLFADL